MNPPTKQLCNSRWFVTKNQKFLSGQFGESDRPTFDIAKLDLEDAGRQQLNNRPNLARQQTKFRLVRQNGYHIQQLGRAFFHLLVIAHSRTPNEGILPQCG